MKRFYFIFTFPVILLVLFSGIYLQFSKTSEEAEKIESEKIALVKKTEDLKKKEEEAKARQDSERRTSERLAEEKKKEDERLAKLEAEYKSIADEGKNYKEQVAANTSEAAKLSKQLAELRAAKESKTRELLETSSEAELAAISKRGAELEIQRMTEMLARKINKGSLTKN